MTKMKYLCVFDMDGTLLDSNHEIPNKNKEALDELKRRGIGVVLATGRTELMTRKYRKELDINLPVISNNGSMVFDYEKNKIIYQNTFCKEILKRIIEYTIKENIDYFIYTIDKVYYAPYSKKIKIMHYYNSLVPENERIEISILPQTIKEVFANLPYGGEKCAFKVLVSDQRSEDEDFFFNLAGVESVSSQLDALDVMPSGSTKGNALEFLVKYLDIVRENVFAFGDNYNDETMLDFAKYAIVPENGVDHIKAIADFITSSNEDAGVAKAIYEFVIPIIENA